MVRTSKQQHRYAFTMIELIFAIVVIAISVMSLPMMTRVTTQGIENNLVQEAIFASVSEINMATTYIWDEHSLIDMDDLNATFNDLSRVINTDGGCIDTFTPDANGVSIIRRNGHIHRRCLDNLLTNVYAGTDYIDALETPEHDFNATFEGGGSSQSAYKQEYESSLVVNYCGDGTCDKTFGTTANDQNIKEIVVTVRNDQDEDVTLLRAYSANIGELAYAWRPL